MAEVGKAYLTVMPSTKGFVGSLSSQVGPAFTTAGRTGGNQLANGVSATGGSKMGAAGKLLGAAFVAGFAAIGAGRIVSTVTGWVMEAVGEASRLEQSLGAVDAIFGDNAETINNWARGAAQDVGLSQNAYSEFATVLGAQLKNMGIDLDEATDKTGWLIETGSDLAAQFGGSTSGAVNALSSLLRGERDPIERYGVSINEAAVKAKLAEMGLSDLTGEAEKNARLQATLALLTEQTADATGTFAREAGTLAGRQARVRAEIENTRTEIGTAFLPIFSDLLGVILDEGVPALRELVDWFLANKDTIYETGIAIADMALGFTSAFLGMLAAQYDSGADIIAGLRMLVGAFFWFADQVLLAAESAYGWIPGVGDRIRGQRQDLALLARSADEKLGLVESNARTMGDAFRAAQGTVDNLRSAVNNLRSKTITVTVNAQGNGVTLFNDGSFRVAGSNLVGRAAGGPVAAGEPYIVGEREPELFVPNQSGRIYNQRQLAAMAGVGTGVSLDGARITGTLAIGGDGLGRIIDGRISMSQRALDAAGRPVG